MKTNYETYTDSNYSSYIKDSNQKNSLVLYPFLNFNESLYNKCQSKFSEFATHKKDDLKLMINSQTKEKISIKDFLENSSNDINKLTPIPFINKRKIKNEGEKKELKNLQRNVVLMRRLEYANKIKENNLKKKYNNKIGQIIFLQKMTRGYLVRKVIFQVNIISESLKNFFFLIKICVWKKYFPVFKYNISQIMINNDKEDDFVYKKIKNNIKNNLDEENDDNNENTLDIGKNNNYLINVDEIDNNKEEKKEEDDTNYININLENENDINNNYSKKSMQIINEQLEKIKNQNLMNINNNNNKIKKNFFEKNNNLISSENKNQKINNNMFENYIKASNLNVKKYNFSYNFPLKNNYKGKVIYIQKYFRKFLLKKEFYGKLGAQKVGFFLIKNIFINNIGGYIFNIMKALYKYNKNDITQEENFIQLDSDRIDEVKQKFNNACESIDFK